MIVSDDMVSTALAYLAEDPHPIAVARKEVNDAENHANRIYSVLFLQAEGSNDVRKAKALIDEGYVVAQHRETDAIRDYERHKAQVESSKMLIEVWRSENANARAAEKVR